MKDRSSWIPSHRYAFTIEGKFPYSIWMDTLRSGAGPNVERCHERIEKRRLGRQDTSPCSIEIEPRSAIDLGKRTASSRARWPLHLEGIASQLSRIGITSHREDVHDLATLLANRAESKCGSFCNEAGLFKQLAPRGAE